eukprot:677299-Pleurochrysis_carterae.AAC.1
MESPFGAQAVGCTLSASDRSRSWCSLRVSTGAGDESSVPVAPAIMCAKKVCGVTKGAATGTNALAAHEEGGCEWGVLRRGRQGGTARGQGSEWGDSFRGMGAKV